MASACERVFKTPELLEVILLQLAPLNELLLTQRISRLFRAAISTSPRLQQRLFLKPKTSGSPKQWSTNPLLRQHFTPFFVIPHDRQASREYETLFLMDWTKTKRDAFLYEKASWRNMLLTQPPAARLRLTSTSHGMAGDYQELAIAPAAEMPAGHITMGLVYDIVESYLRSLEECFSRFTMLFRDTEEGLELHIGFRYTEQCVLLSPDESAENLKSKGANVHAARCLEKWTVNGENLGGMGWRLSEDTETDLTAEKGGVEDWEWDEWVRKRQGIGALGSDVRG